jgi:uncharacterized integral membrane protein (TIGR00697 family)
MESRIRDKELKTLTFVIASYVAIQIFSDLLSLKIINIPIINFSVTAGIILYPLTFTIRDIAHKILGKTNVSYLVISTVTLNVLMIGLLYLVISFPPGSHWELQESFQAVFLPVWRITLASLVAELFSQLADTYLFSYIYQKTKSSFYSVLGSNIFGSILDSALFVIIAFLGSLNYKILIEMIIVQIVIKILVSLTLAPFVKKVPTFVAENQI